MWMGWGCALLVLASCSGEGARSGFDRRAMLEHTATAVILPLHQQLVARAAELTEAGDRFVRAPTAATLGEVQDRWRRAAVAWKRCALFEIGPVQDAFIHYSIYKRPTNVEFVEGYLSGDQVLDADFVETLGSTAKGLPAIEYLVFDAADDDARVLALFQDGSKSVRRRQYLQALTRNLQRKTEKLLAIWAADGQDFVAAFARSDGERLHPQGSIALLTNEMIRSIESILQFRLSKPLGFSGQGVQPDLVEARLSRYSLPLLRANIEAFALAFSAGHGEVLGLDDYVDYLDRPYGDEALLSARIKAQTATVLATIDSFDKSLYETIAEDPTPARQLFAQVRQLLVLVKVNMANVLGVTVTFNALDGD